MALGFSPLDKTCITRISRAEFGTQRVDLVHKDEPFCMAGADPCADNAQRIGPENPLAARKPTDRDKPGRLGLLNYLQKQRGGLTEKKAEELTLRHPRSLHYPLKRRAEV